MITFVFEMLSQAVSILILKTILQARHFDALLQGKILGLCGSEIFHDPKLIRVRRKPGPLVDLHYWSPAYVYAFGLSNLNLSYLTAEAMFYCHCVSTIPVYCRCSIEIYHLVQKSLKSLQPKQILGKLFHWKLVIKAHLPPLWTLVTRHLNYCNSLHKMSSAREGEKSNLFGQGGVNPIHLPAAFAILAAKRAIPHCL